MNSAGMVEDKAQRRLLCSATRRAREDAGPDFNADDRQTAFEIVAGQAQFRAETWNQVTAYDALGAAAKQNEAVLVRARRYQHTGRERAAIAETDVAALEMIFQQAEIFGFHVLQHTKCFHAEVRPFVHGAVRH